MAVQIDGPSFNEPTGTVENPPSTVTVRQDHGQDTTGAADAPPAAVTTEFGPTGQDPTGAAPNPGPVTIRNTSVKVVRAPEKTQSQGATTAETPERTARHAQPADAAPDDAPRQAPATEGR